MIVQPCCPPAYVACRCPSSDVGKIGDVHVGRLIDEVRYESRRTKIQIQKSKNHMISFVGFWRRKKGLLMLSWRYLRCWCGENVFLHILYASPFLADFEGKMLCCAVVRVCCCVPYYSCHDTNGVAVCLRLPLLGMRLLPQIVAVLLPHCCRIVAL